MSRIGETAVNVTRTLHKLYAGVPGEGQSQLAGLVNVGRALQFLIGRKAGFGGTPSVTLGCAGKTHAWPLVDRSDLTVLEEVFLNLEYAIDVPAPKVVFDLGANIGAASVYFAHRWPDARIFAVEPNPETFKRLQATTSGYKNISCLNYAVGQSDGVADFAVSSDHIGSSLHRKIEGGRIVQVQTRSFATLLSHAGADRVDVLKFDVEGAEDGFFQDTGLLEKVGALVGEIHKDLLSCSVDAFLARFKDFVIETRFEGPRHLVISAIRRAE